MPRSPEPRPSAYPTSITIGGLPYQVRIQPRVVGNGSMGTILYATKRIEVATHSALTGLAYAAHDVHDTFWHEVTHGILYEMGHRLYRNERFVRRFASVLTRAIESAQFGEGPA